jgi:hypothetical protein
MPVLDNPKWELAAQEVAKGRTQLAAIEAAGYSPHRSNASRLIANDNIKSRVQELQMEASKTIAITLEGQIAKLEALLEQSQQLKQCSAAIAAIREQNELAGLRVQRTELKTVDQFDSMSDEELRQYVEGKE